MPKTLYLHVGMPKCASTTIQGVLKAHAETFAAQGKFYGFSQRDKTEGQGNATALLADIRNGRTSHVRKALEFFLERETDIILSSEMFIGLARNTQADEFIARAREDGFETRLICYLRRQDHWIESDYKQHIKGGSDWSTPIEDLIRRRAKTRVLDYHWMLENWVRSLGREAITVVPLQRGQGAHYPLERFLQFLGLDPALAPELAVDPQNVSPPTGLIEPMRYLKQALLAQGMKPGDIPKPLHRFLKEAPERLAVPQRRFLLPLKRRKALLERYAKSNAALSRDYFGGASVFEDGLEKDPPGTPPLADEAAAVMASWIVSDPAQLAPPQAESNPAVPAGSVLAADRPSRWWPLRRG